MSAEEHIIPGKILYLEVAFPHEDEPHNKYMVVVGVETQLFLLKINTLEREGAGFWIKPSDYPFLEHNSYLDCENIHSALLTINEANVQLKRDPSRDKGEIRVEHRNEILRLIRGSKVLSRIQKDIIVRGLE